MRHTSFFAAVAVACALCVQAVPSADAADPTDRAARDAAVAAAQPAVAAARKAAKGDKAACQALKTARESLEPFAAVVRGVHSHKTEGTRDPQLATVWNDLLTISEFHGVPGKPEFVLDRHEILWQRYYMGLPTGSAWSWKYNTDAKNNDQLHMFVDQKRPNGQKLRHIKVWTYRWDTVYSGVGGENTKGLAKMMHEVDRDSTAKSGRKVSPAVTAKRMSAEFDRVYYYFVEGFDVDEEKKLRRDNYYMKGDNLSFNLEVISYLDPTDGDDEVTKWQCGSDSDPEIKAVLESLTLNPAKKSKK